MLAIITNDVRFFFDCASELKERGIPFLTLPIDGEVPTTITVIITTASEAPLIDFTNVVYNEDAVGAVKQALALMKNREVCNCIAIGIDPGPFTLRELIQMAEGRRRAEWERAARIVCEVHNCHCTDESQTIELADVHPLLRRVKREPDAEMSISELGELLGHQFPG